jgi:hypothetical protein
MVWWWVVALGPAVASPGGAGRSQRKGDDDMSQHQGMSELSYFAGQALHGIIENADRVLMRQAGESPEAWEKRAAELAWKMAQAMVAAKPAE